MMIKSVLILLRGHKFMMEDIDGGIMINNGLEALNNVFKVERTLSVTAIVEVALQLARFSTSYDSKDNNRSIEGHQNQERQVVNVSTRSER
jgi:hypothetical protein